MPRMDPVPTVPAPPIWNVLFGLMPPTAMDASARRRYAGSSGRRRPGRPQNGGAHSASQPSPFLLDRLPELADGGAALRAQEPGREREREVQADHQCARRAGAQGGQVVDHLLTGAAVAQGDELPVDDVGQPDVRGGTRACARPVDGHHLQGWAHPPASACSLVTVFQFRVVLTTPSRRSRRVPVSLVPA